MENKTDKQLVWEAVKEVERVSAGISYQFAVLSDTIWKDYPQEDTLRIRGKLLTNGLITILTHQHWAFQLTPVGMLLKKSDLKEDGYLKKKWSAELIQGVIIATISALLGLATGTIQAKYLTDNQS